ncbi:hypothetical protein BaRGS_00036304, partial [Batillaria attramentaria]
ERIEDGGKWGRGRCAQIFCRSCALKTRLRLARASSWHAELSASCIQLLHALILSAGEGDQTAAECCEVSFRLPPRAQGSSEEAAQTRCGMREI